MFENGCFWFTVIILSLICERGHVSGDTCSAADNFKVLTEILSFENPERITAPGSKCEKDGDEGCLVRFLVFLDLDEPEGPQEMSVNEVKYTEILRTAETSIAFMPVQVGGKLISKDSCGKKFQGANLRVIVSSLNDDTSPNDSTSVINSFSCIVPLIEPSPQDQESSSWSSMTPCDPALHKDSMGLTFRYRVQEVPSSQCCLS